MTLVTPEGEQLRFECCFCKGEVRSEGFDVSMVVLITNWDGPRGEQQLQDWPCHACCFEKRMQMDVEILIEEFRSEP